MADTKVLWLDLETTGLSAFKNGVIQIAFQLEVNGNLVAEKDYRCQPLAGDTIDKKALEINGTTVEDLKGYDLPVNIHKQVLDCLGKFCNKFNKKDKFWIGGFNVVFDVGFFSQWFRKNNDSYYGSWFNGRLLDVYNLAVHHAYWGRLDLDDYKLVTLAKHFGIELKAHDALHDIRATKELYNILSKDFWK